MTRILVCLGFGLWRAPPGFRRALVEALAWWWWTVLRYRRRTVLANLSQAFPELSPAARRSLARDVFRHLVHLLVELLILPHQRGQGGFEAVGHTIGLEHFEQARAQGRGVLVAAGHLGSWEAAMCAAARHVLPAHIVVKVLPKWLERFVNDLRRSAGLSVLSEKNVLKHVLRALKRNETVVFVIDQNATRKLGVFVNFFGREASTLAGLAVVAARTRAPVVAAIAYRLEDGQQVLAFTPEIPFEPKSTHDDTIRHMTQRYTEVIERAIRAHPAQWFWTHRRWKTQPKPKPKPNP
ncbi:MAG: lysophospholipid acyltransferase family protein [Deltaproteobacteria bacterium]|nr:lysophospholipid acyltransferase family protein [Deltaproteobacteria bacterium]